jgi:hypothetical protein
MPPHGTDGPSPIQKAAAGIGYSTIALHHHPGKLPAASHRLSRQQLWSENVHKFATGKVRANIGRLATQMPITGNASRCARAASGHAAAAPPSVAENFRRPMWLAI